MLPGQTSHPQPQVSILIRSKALRDAIHKTVGESDVIKPSISEIEVFSIFNGHFDKLTHVIRLYQ